MSVGLNAAQARSKASQDMIVYKETQSIMEAIITQSGLGNFEASIDDGTTMTISTPIISDINDAAIPGVTASKDAGYLVLTKETTAGTTWSYEIGAGTANTALGVVAGVYTLPNPTSIVYYTTWQGSTTNRAIQNQMEQVITYFSNLGYKIERLTNTSTTRTIKWYVYW